MLTTSELLAELEVDKKEYARLKAMDTTSPDIQTQIQTLKEKLPRSKLEYWSRVNTPVQCLIFIFLGFSLGIKKGRGRSKNSGATSMIILSLYYIIFFAGISLARKDVIPPFAAIFSASCASEL